MSGPSRSTGGRGQARPLRLSGRSYRSIRRFIAESTLSILESGVYTDSTGTTHAIGEAVEQAANETRVYDPLALEALRLDTADDVAISPHLTMEVTPETTQQATHRMLLDGGEVAVLNFASAKNCCGGFQSGANAQEEDLALSSALWKCLSLESVARDYYKPNRSCGTALYTDRIVYSPKCPFFRISSEELVSPFFPAVVSAPAPNFGAVIKKGVVDDAEFEKVYNRRATYVLEVMRAHGHKRLVLGAWGCGVFKVDPAMAAQVWKSLLNNEFAGAFDRVVFAVYDGQRPGPCFNAFQRTISQDVTE